MTQEEKKKQKLVLQPKVHWSRAIGYLKLEMFEQAREELGALPEELPWSKQKRSMEVEICQAQERWKEMKLLTLGLRMEFPGDVGWWIADAYATRRSKSVEEAREILLEGLVHHYDDATIRFNLACYACQLGSLGECMDLLKEAVKRDERFKALAMEDEDLKEVWDALRNLGWGDVVV